MSLERCIAVTAASVPTPPVGKFYRFLDIADLIYKVKDSTGAIVSQVGIIDMAGSVTNYYLADMPANTIKGNNTGVLDNALDLTVSQVKTMLSLAGSNSGDNVQATEVLAGIAEIATQAETNTGTNDTNFITPLKLTNSTQITSKQNASEKGQPNGYAELDGTGKVPTAQLPSYVDDVLEYANLASFPVTGELGKIYVDLATNKIYRWTGSVYVEISATVGAPVTSVFTRIGAVTAQSGDYTASQVTNAFDKLVDDTDDIAIGVTNKFNQAHTGDVTGATALTIATNVVANSKLSQVATQIFKGRTTAGTGNVEDLTISQAKTLLDLSNTNSGDETTVTHGALINGAASKSTPVDADMLGLMDSAAANILKKLSWLNLKATLKTYFDTIYTTLSSLGIFTDKVRFNNIITPTPIAANTNDYSPAGLANCNVMRVSTNGGNFDCTGIVAQEDGRVIIILNIGSSGTFKLKNNSASSSANNRFLLNGDASLAANEGAFIMYDGTSLRWRICSRF
jgi:hypothetical protein